VGNTASSARARSCLGPNNLSFLLCQVHVFVGRKIFLASPLTESQCYGSITSCEEDASCRVLIVEIIRVSHLVFYHVFCHLDREHHSHAHYPSRAEPAPQRIQQQRYQPSTSPSPLTQLLSQPSQPAPLRHPHAVPKPPSPVSCSVRPQHSRRLRLLVDPVELGRLPALDLTLVEPQGDFLLSVLNRVGAVAHVAADVDGVVAADGAGRGRERVCGAENGTTGLDGVAAFPDHGADGAGAHVWWC
jgi:hypothetical protein